MMMSTMVLFHWNKRAGTYICLPISPS